MHASSRVAVAVLLALAGIARGDIYQREWVDPNDPSQGKRQSAIPCPGGAGVDAVPYADLRSRDLTQAYLIGADLRYAHAGGANLTIGDLRQANLAFVRFDAATFTGAAAAGGSEVDGSAVVLVLLPNAAGARKAATFAAAERGRFRALIPNAFCGRKLGEGCKRRALPPERGGGQLNLARSA